LPGNDLAVFTNLVNQVLLFADPTKTASRLYLKNLSLLNYAVVCGVGVLINMSIIGVLFNLGLGLYVSNAGAILVAFLWNWTFSVGPYGHIFQLSRKEKKQDG